MSIRDFFQKIKKKKNLIDPKLILLNVRYLATINCLTLDLYQLSKELFILIIIIWYCILLHSFSQAYVHHLPIVKSLYHTASQGLSLYFITVISHKAFTCFTQRRLTFPNWSKYCFTSSIVVFTDRPPTKIFFVRVTN